MDGVESDDVSMAKGLVFESARSDAFGGRISQSQLLENRIFQDLDSWGFIYAINGTEHTHPEFVGKIKDSTDLTTLSIRFQPDGVFTFENKSAYIEAKNSVFIERLAYENYMRLHQSGYRVYTVFFNREKDSIGFCRINQLKFVDVLKTPNPKCWPIVDGWLSPRNDPQYKSKIAGWGGSGTDYRKIEWWKLYKWRRFSEIKHALSK